MHIQNITLSHACGAADAGAGVLTWKMFAIKNECSRMCRDTVMNVCRRLTQKRRNG